MDVTFLRGKAPPPGADSPYQGETSRRDKRGRDAVTEGDGEVVTNLVRPLRLGVPPSHLPWEGRPWGTHSNGFPYEGKLSPEATDEVGAAA